MDNIIRVSKADTQLNETPYRRSYSKKCLERGKTEDIDKVSFTDIYDVRQLSSEFNLASQNSELVNIRSISKELTLTIGQYGESLLKDKISFDRLSPSTQNLLKS